MKSIMTVAALAIMALAPPQAASAAAFENQVVKTDDGYLLGNPSAPVKLVVLSSYGCPHCRILDQTMMDPLRRKWIATGKVSLRYVPYGMFPTDVPAMFLAECGSPSGFFTRADRIFQMQAKTASRFSSASEDAKKGISEGPSATMPARLSDLSGLAEASTAVGVPRAAYSRCLADPKLRTFISTRQKLIENRYQFQGTPAIWVNGHQTGTGSSWPRLEAILASISH